MEVISRVHTNCIINKLTLILCLFILIQSTRSINLGLIAGDLKRSGPGPLVVRKVSHHSPVIINVNPGLPKLPGIATLPRPTGPKLPKLPGLATLPPIPLPKLPAKPPPSLFRSSKIKRSPLRPLFPLFPPPLLPPLLPPVIPHLPLLPILPPIMPPLLPLMPPPLLGMPRLPRLPLFGYKIPRIGKTPLEKTLGTFKLPVTDKVLKRTIFKDLLDLKIKGSLTTPEYFRFKRLLLK